MSDHHDDRAGDHGMENERMIRRSLHLTTVTITAALAVDCPECGTAEGSWCSITTSTLVTGLCSRRYLMGRLSALGGAGVSARTPAGRTADLAERAAAANRISLHRGWRERREAETQRRAAIAEYRR